LYSAAKVIKNDYEIVDAADSEASEIQQAKREDKPIRIHGNLTGVKSEHRRRAENLYRRKINPHDIISPELSRDLARLSFEIGRQLGLLIGREGRVEMVLIGGPNSIYIADLPKSRASRGRLRGLRLVHTHLNGESVSQDDLMDLVFLRLDSVCVVHVDRHGGATTLELAHILPTSENGSPGWEILPPIPCYRPDLDFLSLVQSLEAELERNRLAVAAVRRGDRAIAVGVTTADRKQALESMNELVELAHTGGIEVADKIIQRPRQINPRYLIGKGKLSEIILRALQLGVDLLIFNQELNPSQVRSITDMTELRVIDRTQLILDIFAQRAQSREGKIQVEMAQLQYLLPRLGVKDDALSRLTGGIGARGPGETKLEVNRRRIKDRISHLEHLLQNVRKSRQQKRSLRMGKALPVVSIVGYTNAGKSTLLNTLTHSEVFVESQLFATLDPTSRRLRFPRDFEVIVTDTVGFVKDLPKDLLDAFAATLEELQDADLLLHVIDVSDPRIDDHIESVETILTKLDLHRKPIIPVFNKIDLAPAEVIERNLNLYGGVAVSALTRKTLMPLIRAMEDHVEALLTQGLFPAALSS
jgi:GTP-binding protein HflX